MFVVLVGHRLASESCPTLLLAQQQIDDPTSANVCLLRVSAVVQHVFVVTTGVLECIRENRQAIKGTVSGDALSEGNDSGCEPTRLQTYVTEWIAECDKPQFRTFFKPRILDGALNTTP